LALGDRVTIGGSLLLIALGAILKFAVTADVAGIDLETVGVILMIVGAIGLLVGLFVLVRTPSGDLPPRL
jgi:hypothetical protein